MSPRTQPSRPQCREQKYHHPGAGAGGTPPRPTAAGRAAEEAPGSKTLNLALAPGSKTQTQFIPVYPSPCSWSQIHLLACCPEQPPSPSAAAGSTPCLCLSPACARAAIAAPLSLRCCCATPEATRLGTSCSHTRGFAEHGVSQREILRASEPAERLPPTLRDAHAHQQLSSDFRASHQQTKQSVLR